MNINNDLRKDAEATLSELGVKFKITYVESANNCYVVMAIVGNRNKVVRGSGRTINECCNALLRTAKFAWDNENTINEIKYTV